MQLVVVTVFDRVTACYGRPFFVTHAGSAIRSFADEINNPSTQSDLFKHSADYDLYELGVFDDGSAIFDLLERPKLIALGKDHKVPDKVN